MRVSRRRGARVLAAAAVVAVAVLLFLVTYVAAARWLLSGPKLRSLLNVHPERTMLNWDEAVSRWPGRLRVKNLRIRGSDQNVQWIITIPEARVRFSILALATRTFRTSRVEASAIGFRLRQKVEPEKARLPKLRLLPPVSGFSDPPLREEVAPPTPSRSPWSVDVRGITSENLEELWIDLWRYRGRARLEGRFFLTAGRHARVGPAAIDLEEGELRLGPTPVLSEVKGRIEATFSDWDPRETQGDEVWDFVSGRVSLEGPTESAAFLGEAKPLGRGARLSGGPGRLSLSGEIDRGQARGEILLSAKNGKYERPGLTVVGDARGRLKIAGWKLNGGEPRIDGSSLSVSEVFAEGGVRSRAWRGEFTIPSGRLDGGLSGHVVLKCTDGRPLLAFLGAKLPKWTSGLVELEDLGASAMVVLSPARTSARRIAAKGGKFEIEGEYERRGESSRGVFLIESGVLRVGVALENGKSTLRLFGPRGWFEKERGRVEETGRSRSDEGDR